MKDDLREKGLSGEEVYDRAEYDYRPMSTPHRCGIKMKKKQADHLHIIVKSFIMVCKPLHVRACVRAGVRACVRAGVRERAYACLCIMVHWTLIWSESIHT